MSSYIELMNQTSATSLDMLYRGVEKAVLTDFPDYPNVGDSAIALGVLAHLRGSGVKTETIYALTTLSPRILTTSAAVIINGGGNLGGLYPPISQHRYYLADQLADDVLLIQSPQSVHFVSDAERRAFHRSFGARANLRLAVRDRNSFESVHGIRGEVMLAPDAAHRLGHIASPDPRVKYIVLARRDSEAAAQATRGGGTSVDWPKDRLGWGARAWLRWRFWRFLPQLKGLLNSTPSAWEALAQGRLERGLNILSLGEIVVTDRLHAMLLALQMGRQVIAVDNANAKLSSYAEAWFGSAQPSVVFEKSFAAAEVRARRGIE